MIVQCDASALEWRVLTELSNDQTALAEILEGKDTHSLNQQAFELPSRLIAKIYLFRTIYRGSGYAFSVDPAFSHVSSDPKFWDGIGEKFYRKYNGIDRIHNLWAEQVMRGEALIGPLGREWFIDLGRDRWGNIKCPWTKLTNYPVQGTGADVMMIARISFYRRLKASGIPALLVSTVHDSICCDVPKEYAAQTMVLMYEVFEDLVKNINLVFKCNWITPLNCECKYGPNFKEQKKITKEECVKAIQSGGL